MKRKDVQLALSTNGFSWVDGIYHVFAFHCTEEEVRKVLQNAVTRQVGSYIWIEVED